MDRSKFAVSRGRIAGLLVIACGAWLAPAAHAQWIDAGGMANQMHQHDLLRDQTLRDPPDDDDGDAQETKSQARAANRPQAVDQVAMKAEMQRMIERRKRELLPEYERRVRADGRPSADRWLRDVATEMGRRDGAEIRARYGQ